MKKEQMTQNYDQKISIGKEYISVCNEAAMKRGDITWKSFYPHQTFKDILESFVNALERNSPEKTKPLWISGAYGTGKTYAALTLKNILETDEIEDYFSKFNINPVILSKIKSLKKRKIITTFRSGSSNIKSDEKLAIAIQETIQEMLKEQGIKNRGLLTMKEKFIDWLSKQENATYLDTKLKDPDFLTEVDLGNTPTVKSILNRLHHGTAMEVESLLEKIDYCAHCAGIRVISYDIASLKEWIIDVINKNELGGIVFIGDEFTDYFKNNTGVLSGLQALAELSKSTPFYLLLVTHKTPAQLSITKDSVINDRFVKKEIKLPDNTAFELIANAIEVKDNELRSIAKEVFTEGDIQDINERISQQSDVKLETLQALFPITPYSAFIMKKIAENMMSNTRSVFTFIKGEKDNDIQQNFQTFLEQTNENDDFPLLTCDWLWDFTFSSQTHLNDELVPLKAIYQRNEKTLSGIEQRLLKAIIILYHLDLKETGFSLLTPTKEHILSVYHSCPASKFISKALDDLKEKQILYTKPLLTGGKDEYCYTFLMATTDEKQIKDNRESLEKEWNKTDRFITEYDIHTDIFKTLQENNPIFQSRFFFLPTYVTNIKENRNKARACSPAKIPLFCIYARSEEEVETLSLSIKEILKENKEKVERNENPIVILDMSSIHLENQNYQGFLDALANISSDVDKETEKIWKTKAKGYIDSWKDKFKNGAFNFITDDIIPIAYTEIQRKLLSLVKKYYPKNLDDLTKTKTILTGNQIKVPIKNGLTEDYTGACKVLVKSPFLQEIKNCNQREYWESLPENKVAMIKSDINHFIAEKLKKDKQVLLMDIWNKLQSKPIGFLPIPVYAFMLGFILKEFATSRYTWTNGSHALSNIDHQTISNWLQEVVLGTNSTDYAIREMGEEEKIFLHKTAEIFETETLHSLEQSAVPIRQKLIEIKTPLWCISNAYLDNKKELNALVACYHNFLTETREIEKPINEVAVEITKLLEKNSIFDQIKKYCAKDNSRLREDAMQKYIATHEPRLIELSQRLGLPLLDDLREKCSQDSAWLWKEDTFQNAMQHLCDDYNLLSLSQEIIPHVVNKDIAKLKMTWEDELLKFKLPKTCLCRQRPVLTQLFQFLDSIDKHVHHGQVRRFYNYLNTNQNELKNLFNDSMLLFDEYLERHTITIAPKDKRRYYNDIISTLNTPEASFDNMLDDLLEGGKTSLELEKIKDNWEKLTHSPAPKYWSQHYGFPIRFMIDSNHQDLMFLFALLNGKHATHDDIVKATDIIHQHKQFLSSLQDTKTAENVFSKKILGVLIPESNALKIKNYLKTKLGAEKIDEWSDKDIENEVKSSLTLFYDIGECVQKIDSLNIKQSKEILETLAKEDITLLISIFRHLS